MGKPKPGQRTDMVVISLAEFLWPVINSIWCYFNVCFLNRFRNCHSQSISKCALKYLNDVFLHFDVSLDICILHSCNLVLFGRS
jgi:hypothetical protein